LVSAFALDHAGARDGVVRTLPALRRYFERALAAYPDLRFEPIAALPGVDSVAPHYRSVDGRHRSRGARSAWARAARRRALLSPGD
jgi:hypothetical protein